MLSSRSQRVVATSMRSIIALAKSDSIVCCLLQHDSPHDYGFVKHTLSLDGDPLDALVLLDEPTFPGCIVSCRAVGMFRMVDEKGGDDKLLCVAASDIRKNGIRTSQM